MTVTERLFSSLILAALLTIAQTQSAYAQDYNAWDAYSGIQCKWESDAVEISLLEAGLAPRQHLTCDDKTNCFADHKELLCPIDLIYPRRLEHLAAIEINFVDVDPHGVAFPNDVASKQTVSSQVCAGRLDAKDIIECSSLEQNYQKGKKVHRHEFMLGAGLRNLDWQYIPYVKVGMGYEDALISYRVLWNLPTP